MLKSKVERLMSRVDMQSSGARWVQSASGRSFSIRYPNRGAAARAGRARRRRR